MPVPECFVGIGCDGHKQHGLFDPAFQAKDDVALSCQRTRHAD